MRSTASQPYTRFELYTYPHHIPVSVSRYIDVEREAPYKVLDMGQAIKKVYTIKNEYHNKQIPSDAKSDSVFAILDDHTNLHNNVRANQATPRTVTEEMCQTTPELCGLYAHCGSSLSRKYQYSYPSATTAGVKVRATAAAAHAARPHRRPPPDPCPAARRWTASASRTTS